LAQALERILSDREQARRMGKAARQRVLDQFSLAREAEGIGRVYAQLFAQS
jgi:mannosyltransferase